MEQDVFRLHAQIVEVSGADSLKHDPARGALTKQLRKLIGLTPTQWAIRMEVTTQTIHRWERGALIPAPKLSHMVNLFSQLSSMFSRETASGSIDEVMRDLKAHIGVRFEIVLDRLARLEALIKALR